MKNSIGVLSVSKFYHSAVKAELKRRGFQKNTAKKIIKTHKEIMNRAKEIGNSRLVSSYVMGSYFIAMNRSTGKSPEENYQIFRDGLCASSLFKKVMGDAESYLSPKKMEGRLKWSEESHKRKYENDWVVDILPGNDEYDLGYDYLECGICKLCNDEGCPELAQYLCRMDFVLADIMNMKLVRTGLLPREPNIVTSGTADSKNSACRIGKIGICRRNESCYCCYRTYCVVYCMLC